MPKKFRVRTLMDCQNVNGSEKRLEYARQYFFLITLKINQLQKLFFSSINNLETVC